MRSVVSCPACAAASVNSMRYMQGYSKKQAVFLTPIMFGVAHLHHLLELVKFQGARLSSASAVVSLPENAHTSMLNVRHSFHAACRWHAGV